MWSFAWFNTLKLECLRSRIGQIRGYCYLTISPSRARAGADILENRYQFILLRCKKNTLSVDKTRPASEASLCLGQETRYGNRKSATLGKA